ncbi:MAG: hypothetical protein ACOYO0_03330 [Sandarakinorhabdus sp.]
MPALSGEMLWAAAFLFYFFDSLQPATANSIIVERAWSRYNAKLLRYPPGAFGKRFYIPNPVTPFSIVLSGAWSASPSFKALPTDQAFILNANLNDLWWHRVLSGSTFLILFVFIPAIASVSNVTVGLLFGLPALYGLNLTQAVLIWRRRKLLGWTGWKAVGFSAHFLLCIPYGANVARSLAAHYQHKHDMLNVALCLALGATIQNVIEPLLADMASVFNDTDQSAIMLYRRSMTSYGH